MNYYFDAAVNHVTAAEESLNWAAKEKGEYAEVSHRQLIDEMNGHLSIARAYLMLNQPPMFPVSIHGAS